VVLQKLSWFSKNGGVAKTLLGQSNPYNQLTLTQQQGKSET
jgi:hypothetical protein